MPVDHPKSRATRLLALFAVTASLLTPAAPVLAAEGSVPSEVTRYATDPDGLLARLDDLFGVTSSGQGIDFRETAQTGAITRAWVFTAGYLAGEDPETAVELTNLWTVPVLVDEAPLGLATIWINPATDAPDLADFVVSRGVAQALSEVPEDARLVRDEPRGAWFALVAGKLVVLVPGTSGVVGSTTLADYQSIAGSETPQAPRDMSGLVGGGILIGVTVLAILAVLLIPQFVRGRREKSAAEADTRQDEVHD